MIKKVQIEIDKNGNPILPNGRFNLAKIKATTEKDIAQHQKIDNYQALMEVALSETRAELEAGSFVKETVSEHIKRIDRLNKTSA